MSEKDLSDSIDRLGDTAMKLIDHLKDQRDEYREILGDLVDLDNEERVMGRYPGFKERHEKAWTRAREKFEP